MTLTAGQIMSRGLKTIHAEINLGDATNEIKGHGKRHLVVIDPKTRALLGIVSDRDLKKFISPFIGTSRETDQDKATMLIKVEKIMHKDVFALTAETPIKTVVEKMLEKRVGSTIIVDEHRIPIGIITRTDILKAMLNFL